MMNNNNKHATVLYLFIFITVVFFGGVCWATLVGHKKTSPLKIKVGNRQSNGVAHTAITWSLVIYVCVENITILQDDRQQMVWDSMSVFVSETRGNGVCSAVWK